MNKYIYILSLTIISCSNIQECPEFDYNSENNLTTLKNGEKYTGRCITHKDGFKRSVQQYVNGVDYGKWVFYFSNGRIETKGKFKNGIRVGKWKYYYESGKLKQTSSYNRKGQRDGKWIEYDESGNILNILTYE